MSIMAGLLVALLASLITTTVYVAIVWRLDRFEKEPVHMLALAFLWGALPAILVSIVFEILLEIPIDALVGTAIADVLVQSGAAPVVEEIAKGLALLAFLVFAYREFDDALDGIVYGAMIGFGFAFTENILYVTSSIAEDGIAAGAVLLFLRTVIFGLNHAFFTSLLGACIGAARLTPRLAHRVALLVAGFLLAVSFHAIHNLGTALVDSAGLIALLISVIFDWGGILCLLLVVVASWRKEQGWMKEELADEVRLGVLTIEEYTAIASPAGRQRLLGRVLRREGWASYRRMQRLYTLQTELALKKHQRRVMGEERALTAAIDRLREDIVRERLAVIAAPA
jgi:protease PrsW